jgi:hypothetical protein
MIYSSMNWNFAYSVCLGVYDFPGGDNFYDDYIFLSLSLFFFFFVFV